MFHRCKTEAEIEQLYEEIMDLFDRVSSGYEKADEQCQSIKHQRDIKDEEYASFEDFEV